MDMLTLPRALMAFCVFLVVYVAYIRLKRGKPVTLPDPRVSARVPSPIPRIPAYPDDLPTLTQPRNWTPNLDAYLNLIFFALNEGTPCCLPIDPAYVPAIEAWYEDASQDIVLSLEVIQRGSTGKMARILVSPEAPTGKHKAIRL